MSIGQLTGYDRNELAEVSHDSMMMFIGHYADIRRIADTLCAGSIYQAWGDVIEKGVLEMITICEMDEEMTKKEKKC